MDDYLFHGILDFLAGQTEAASVGAIHDALKDTSELADVRKGIGELVRQGLVVLVRDQVGMGYRMVPSELSVADIANWAALHCDQATTAGHLVEKPSLPAEEKHPNAGVVFDELSSAALQRLTVPLTRKQGEKAMVPTCHMTLAGEAVFSRLDQKLSLDSTRDLLLFCVTDDRSRFDFKGDSLIDRTGEVVGLTLEDVESFKTLRDRVAGCSPK